MDDITREHLVRQIKTFQEELEVNQSDWESATDEEVRLKLGRRIEKKIAAINKWKEKIESIPEIIRNETTAFDEKSVRRAEVKTDQTSIKLNHNLVARQNKKPDFAASLGACVYGICACVQEFFGFNAEAIINYNKAILLKPNSADLYYYRGNVKNELGDKQGAIADYTEAIRIAPDYSYAYRSRAWVKHLMGDNQDALDDIDQSLNFNPKSSAAHHIRGKILFYGLCRESEAYAPFSAAIHLAPDLSEAYYDRGVLRLKRGDADAAIADFFKAVRLTAKLRLQSEQSNKIYQNSLARIKEARRGLPYLPNID